MSAAIRKMRSTTPATHINTLLIDLKCTDIDKGLYTYYIRDERFGSHDGVDEDENGNAVATELNSNLAKTFHQVRESGIYQVQIFDPDGDGRYEYMWYKPATFGKIDMDDDYDFTDFSEYTENKPVIEAPKDAGDNGLSKLPKIYANGATIDGAKGTTFRDGDFVFAYLNGDANYIYYFGSASAKKGTITAVNEPTGTVTIGNQSFRTCYQFRFVENFFQYDNDRNPQANSGSASTSVFSYLVSKLSLNDEVILYTYNKNYNNVFYYEVVSSGTSSYSGENLLIPLEVETEKGYDDNSHKTIQYLKVWVEGKERYVAVDVDECYPKPTKTIDGTYKFDVSVTETIRAPMTLMLARSAPIRLTATVTTPSTASSTMKIPTVLPIISTSPTIMRTTASSTIRKPTRPLPTSKANRSTSRRTPASVTLSPMKTAIR